MLDRAWGVREKVRLKLERHRGGDHAEQVWQASMEDVAAKFTIGPIFDPSEVDTILGRKEWLPMPRFGVTDRFFWKRLECDARETAGPKPR